MKTLLFCLLAALAANLASAAGTQTLRKSAGAVTDGALVKFSGTSGELTAAASEADVQSAGGLEIGADVQAYHSNLDEVSNGVLSNALPVNPGNELAAFAIDVTLPKNTKSVSADPTFTFSATPEEGAVVVLEITETGSAARTVTIPSSFSPPHSANKTTFTLQADEMRRLTFIREAARWVVWGVPVLISELTEDSSAAGTEIVEVETSGVSSKMTLANLVSIAPATTGIYRTIWIDAAAMVPRTTNGAATSTAETATNDIMIDSLLFDGTTGEGAQWRMMMPDEWDRSTVKVKVFWDAASGASAADTVEWEVSAGALSNDDAIDTALGTAVTVGDVVIAVGDVHVTAASGALTVGGTPALGDMTIWQIVRDPTGTDDMTEDARLLGVAIQYLESTTEPSAW